MRADRSSGCVSKKSVSFRAERRPRSGGLRGVEEPRNPTPGVVHGVLDRVRLLHFAAPVWNRRQHPRSGGFPNAAGAWKAPLLGSRRRIRSALRTRDPARYLIPMHAVSVHAPGRVELLGNHTDYNEGYVLSAAIDRGVTIRGS